MTFAKKVLNNVWPIQRVELKKFIPMLILFFCIGFVYNTLRSAKDTLIVTCQDSGAQIIPFIKVWVMLPAAVLMTGVFSWLSNKCRMEKVFYIIISIFIVYFIFFAFVLYPNREVLHLHSLGNSLELYLPQGCSGLISMIRYWSFTTFYVMSELWSCIVLSILFWGFANDVTNVREAKRFYALFGIGINFSAIVAGQTSIFLSRSNFFIANKFGTDPWQASLSMITCVIVFVAIISLVVFRWMHVNVLNDPVYSCPNTGMYKAKSNYKMSIRKNFAYLANSRYLICIALIVVSYNLVINLIEVIWKDQIRMLYPNPNDFNVYLNQITIITGVIATIIALFSSTIINKFGWTKSAIISPIIFLGTSIGFFVCFLFKGSLNDVLMVLFGVTPLALVVFFGSVQNCLSRAFKFTLFDATKELAFIPLASESKRKGKAAIDGVGSRMGKSGGSLVHQGLLMVFATLAASAPFVAVISIVVILVWMLSVKALGKEFKELVDKNETIEVQENSLEPKTVTSPSE